MDGNLSVRHENGFLVTRTSCAKGLLTEEDVLAVDALGAPLAPDGPRPTSELAMHLACYAARPETQAIIHAHPPLAVARTLVGKGIPEDLLPEAALITGPVPVVPYALTGTSELAERVGLTVRAADVVLLERHGAVAVGNTLEQALIRIETLEHTAHILNAAEALGTIEPMDRREVSRLRALREFMK